MDNEKKIYEMLKEIDTENDIDKEIAEKSEYIAKILYISNYAEEKIKDNVYIFKYRLLNNKKILMVAINKEKYTLLGNKYIPYTLKQDYNENFSIQDNLASIIEAFIRFITDNIKVEEIEES